MKYLLNVLENCAVDVRDYLSQNPFDEFKD